jgi:hypothetical protein
MAITKHTKFCTPFFFTMSVHFMGEVMGNVLAWIRKSKVNFLRFVSPRETIFLQQFLLRVIWEKPGGAGRQTDFECPD